MAVTFHFPDERASGLVSFAWSPLHEAVLSLPVVVHPKHTPMHLPWARRCRDLPDDLRDEIRLLAGTFHGFVPGLFGVGLTGDRPDFDEDLLAFEALDDDLVAYELALSIGDVGCNPDDDPGPHAVHDAGFRADVLARASVDPVRLELATQLFDDPAQVRDRYVRMLRRYWDRAFADEWERLLPRIEQEVTDGARALVLGGARRVVAELLPEGRWDAEQRAIVIPKDWTRDCDVGERGPLLFVPTVYGWPRVLVELAEPWPVSVIFPLRDLRQPAAPLASDAEVADGLRAISDETRLQIARLVAEDPRSTKELAELLSLSDSAISRHLKILEGAGLVAGRRDGYFVLYELRPERLDVLGRALRSTLGLASAGAGDVPALPVSLPREGVR